MSRRSGGRRLADLQIELQVVDADDRLRLIDFDGDLVPFMIGSESGFLCPVMHRLFAFGGPIAQRFRRIGTGSHRSAKIAVNKRSVVSAADLDDEMTFMHPEGD